MSRLKWYILPVLVLIYLLFVPVGCTKYKCADYTALGRSAHEMEALFPEYKAQLHQCAVDNLAWGILCGQGYKADADTYDKCMELAMLLVTPKPAAPPPVATDTPPVDSTHPAASQGLTDDIDPASVTWVGDPAGVQNWKITYDLTVSFKGNDIVLAQQGTANWPEVNGAAANPWVVTQVSGKWYGASFEWMRHNATTRPKSTVSGGNIKVFNVFPDGWNPQAGDQVCFTVAALSRGRFEGKWTWEYNKVYARTPIRCVVWP